MKEQIIKLLVEQIAPLLVMLIVTVVIPYLVALVGKWLRLKIGQEQQSLYGWIALEAVKYAEQLLPDRGQGAERFSLAAAYLVKRLPALAGQEDRIRAMIEEAVWQMDFELKQVIAGGPTQPG